MNYASGLSPYENKGECGMPELYNDSDVVAEKSSQLAALMRDSRHVVVITGAGVSTAAGIPDFRGPSGMLAGNLVKNCLISLYACAYGRA